MRLAGLQEPSWVGSTDWEKEIAPKMNELLSLLENDPMSFTGHERAEAFDALEKFFSFNPVYFESLDIDGETPHGNANIVNFNEAKWAELKTRFDHLHKKHYDS